MDRALFAPAIDEIRSLHDSILSRARSSLDSAIRVGELLGQVKGALKHGEWLPWLKQFAPFTDQTARNYLYCFENKDALKSQNVLDLTGAYKLQRNGNTPDGHQQLHEPNFHSQAVRIRQNLIGLFNHHLQRRPLRRWQTEELYDLFCSLNPITEVIKQLESELNNRSDVPSAYRQANAGRLH